MRATTVQSKAIWALVRRQHGVIARWQLIELGMSAKAIKHRVATGRLHPVYRGVYAVGRPDLTAHGRWMAAVLACGEGAVLSHGEAAELWGVGQAGREIAVTVPSRRNPKVPGIRVRRRDLTPAEIAERDGILVTSPLLTLIDLAAEQPPRAVEDAIGAADKIDLIDPETLRAELDHVAPRPGIRMLKHVLDELDFEATDSALERRFLALVKKAGLPEPLTQHRVNGFRVDFYWPELGLVVETDGLRYHRTPRQQARDRIRDQAHVAAGLAALRFTRAQVFRAPGYVMDTLVRTAALRP